MGGDEVIILDTHALIWVETEQDRIPPLILEMIKREPEVGIPSISLWEIAMLVQKGRIELDIPIYDWFERVFDKPRFRLLPLSPTVAIQSGTLDMHGDPADRLIHQLDFVNAVW